METKELINLINRQLAEFDVDRDEAEENDAELDYAYADGAYNAYEFLLKRLMEEGE